MNYGSETGRMRSGTKGFSDKTKKMKRKKQEFHTHRRARLLEAGEIDLEQVRARTTLALDRLGHQVLSNEPGGYDLEDWTKNLNSLLDDFQEKAGADRISDEFRERRSAALLPFSQPRASHDVDSEIERAIKEEAAAKEAIAELARMAAARLAALKGERETCEKELKLARENLAELTEAKRSRQFFSRLLGSGPSTEHEEARVAELEARLTRLGNEIDSQKKGRFSEPEGGSPVLAAQRKLEAIQERMSELQTAKQSSLQLSREREVATKTISEMISSMNLAPLASKDGSPGE